MSLEHSDAERRRSAAPDLGQEEAESPEVAPNPPGLASSPKAAALGNAEVQGAIAGGGGAFAQVVAAEMLMATAGFDPALLGSDSNSSVQQAMLAGGDQGQPGMAHAVSSLVGGGQLPDAATNRMETATGGTLGPISGISGSVPGIARHFVDPAREGSSGTAPRDPGDVGQVFGAMASMSDADLDRTLREAGRGLV